MSTYSSVNSKAGSPSHVVTGGDLHCDPSLHSCCRVPEECPEDVADLIAECLSETPLLRPSAREVIERLQVIREPRNTL